MELLLGHLGRVGTSRCSCLTHPPVCVHRLVQNVVLLSDIQHLYGGWLPPCSQAGVLCAGGGGRGGKPPSAPCKNLNTDMTSVCESCCGLGVPACAEMLWSPCLSDEGSTC